MVVAPARAAAHHLHRRQLDYPKTSGDENVSHTAAFLLFSPGRVLTMLRVKRA